MSGLAARIAIQTNLVENAKKGYDRAFAEMMVLRLEMQQSLFKLSQAQERYSEEVRLLEDIKASAIVYDKDGHLVFER